MKQLTFEFDNNRKKLTKVNKLPIKLKENKDKNVNILSWCPQTNRKNKQFRTLREKKGDTIEWFS